jgi:beta-lactamase class A
MKHMKFARILFFIIVVVVCLFFGLNQLATKRVNDITVITNTPSRPPAPAIPIQTGTNSLKSVVDNALEGTTGTYGIVIKNLKTSEFYFVNAHTVFDTGSLYKLWVMATVYEQIQNGQLQEDQMLKEDVAVLNQKFHISSESAERTEGTVTFTVRDALTQMITTSDNYAALLLSEKVRLSSVAAFLKEHNFGESAVGTTGGSPTSTPSDVALFFEKLYNGELANEHYTDEMMNVLKNQRLTNGIPKYLPDTSKVADKTGEIGAFKHDAAIILTDNGEYIIVVMSETDAPLAAQERIALVSKVVFNYFTGTERQ